MPPQVYDPAGEDERPVPLPNAPRIRLGGKVELQPPLTFRGTGPGLIVFLPAASSSTSTSHKPLDPEPVQKWAEEGYAVVGITGVQSGDVKAALDAAQKGIKECKDVEAGTKLGVIVYDPSVLDAVFASVDSQSTVLISYGASASTSLPSIFHVPEGTAAPKVAQGDTQGTVKSDTRSFSYATQSPLFALPTDPAYLHSAANVAHTRSLTFLKKQLDGPYFPLEEIWDEHTAFEFATRAVAKTMGTMVQEPYVNHVPTLTGGIGRANLTSFYRDHFIYANPADFDIELISRTVGIDRVVDEFVVKMTHDREVDWMLPGVPPTGRYVEVPFISVVNIRGDRLYHEHIWWDQATLLLQLGLLPTDVTVNGQTLRLPIAGIECVDKLRHPEEVASNEMFGPAYGVQKAKTNGLPATGFVGIDGTD